LIACLEKFCKTSGEAFRFAFNKLHQIMMKHLLPAFLVAAAAGFAAETYATVWTVSNNANRPAQYTTIQAAVNAASPNDTILITGGSYSGTVTAQIPLVYYGESINGTTQFPQTTISSTFNLNRLNSSMSASGSRFYGIRFNSTVSINGSFSGSTPGQEIMSDLIFERCSFISGSSANLNYSAGKHTQMTVRNCLFLGGISLPAATSGPHDIVVTNCVFSPNSAAMTGSGDFDGGVLIRNSLFMDHTSSSFTGSISDIVLENNIFYKAEPTGLSASTWNNNLTYLCNSNTIPYGSNFGSGNIVNQNPLFVNYPALGAAHSFNHNYTLQAGSPCIGTGTNGIDIGLNSGNAPVSNIPIYGKIPGVTVLSIPVSSVPVGGTLQIQIEAESRD
jgi:hypothetical protein